MQLETVVYLLKHNMSPYIGKKKKIITSLNLPQDGAAHRSTLSKESHGDSKQLCVFYLYITGTVEGLG